MTVHRTELPELVRTFGERGEVTVQYEGKPATITVADAPVLEVQRKSGPKDEGFVTPSLHALLAEVDTAGGALLIPIAEGSRVQTHVRLRHVESARLDLGEYHPPDERLTWGIGVGLGGPSLLLAPFFEFRPARWVGLEIGGLGGPSAAWGFVAARASPVRLGVVRPYLGGFFQGILGWESEADASNDALVGEQDETTLSAAGPRFGIEIELQRGHASLRAELDLVHPLSERWAFDQTDDWIPFGGLSFSYFP